MVFQIINMDLIEAQKLLMLFYLTLVQLKPSTGYPAVSYYK